MPFARNHQDPEYKDRQHWFVKRQDGKPYETPWGGTSLDLTHPEVRTISSELIKTIHSWGFELLQDGRPLDRHGHRADLRERRLPR